MSNGWIIEEIPCTLLGGFKGRLTKMLKVQLRRVAALESAALLGSGVKKPWK
jgi:hypothetical protein